jgi:hypothetical protein
MDIDWRSIIDEAQSRNWWKTTDGEDWCIAGNKWGVGSGAIIEGIQKCFCMDIQRFEKDSTRANTTQNWVGHYYTASTLGQVHIKSKLCYNGQTKYK